MPPVPKAFDAKAFQAWILERLNWGAGSLPPAAKSEPSKVATKK